jgi:2-haloacid dehalogenase
MHRGDPGPSGIVASMPTPQPPLDYGRFEALTFDCYGTLIDWEAGLLAAFRPILAARGIGLGDDVLERYAKHEATAEAGPYLRYRDVLAAGLRGVASELRIQPTAEEIEAFSGSVADWPAFPDSPAALARLHTRFRLGVITNCDDDLFAASARRLGIEFDWVVTAQQVGSYKPNEVNFLTAFARLGLPRERILHVAQSLFHDHAPAKRLGLSTVWIDRRHDRPGAGATPPASASPDAVYPDLASFATAATA